MDARGLREMTNEENGVGVSTCRIIMFDMCTM